MEIEKVKEIKKVLECCCILTNSDLPLETRDNACNSCPYELEWCSHVLIKNALCVINDLESKNESLNECYKVKAYDKLRVENKELKHRIAGLEKENKENNSYAKGYADGIKNTYEVVVPDKLKQFAKMLKAEIPAESTFEYLGYNGVMEIIDETLKELIGK